MNNDLLARAVHVQTQDDYHTCNYPPEDDTPTLIDQSLDGGPLSSKLQDAAQGRDPRAREAFAHAAERDFGANKNNPDSVKRKEMGERGQRLAEGYADARGRQFESGPGGGGAGEDVGGCLK